ncbi:hypothetical protein N0V93_000587 [Gnomoniopsis smithogilvyi]|uniref:Helicase C-terminal domain-containing protein n=1 Tax=Gnomoniopsis smithogilvyi TaxID=1191159 RepID=A0A9W8Z272_9PEZI|nr:hypothetical protein N0V93_000587 [Gnomoniopsis smithogilvyi]
MSALMTADHGDEDLIPAGCLVYPLDQSDKVSRRYRDLVSNKWIRLKTVASDDENVAITQVYLLPDDQAKSRIDRSNSHLRQKKKTLLSELDFSAATWYGASKPPNGPSKFPSLSPAARLAVAGDDENISLLRMFNSIPSPEPDVNIIDDDFDREFMSDLLASAVNGLTTELYPYQCRSAAMMHQKEVQAAQLLDPRLIEVLDQDGGIYYYNAVTGDAFREPRYYDAVRGGILAEEMGSGKTLICLALIAATRDQPAYAPDIYQGNNITIRPKLGSLMDMAAAVATKFANPWKRRIPPWHKHKLNALKRNPGWYYLPRAESRRPARGLENNLPPHKIYLSHATLVVVPANLLQQWKQEISKHTQGLKVHIIGTKSTRSTRFDVPTETDLIDYDIVLSSIEALDTLWQEHRRPEKNGLWIFDCPLGRIHFKRCIVDEGHKLGNVKLSGARTELLQALDSLHIDARWIATGTPSQGLFGTEEGSESKSTLVESTAAQERMDLERIGAIATLYLKARPWSNTVHDYGDTIADWKVYIMQRRHSAQSGGRADCLRSTFNSLIIRHRLSEVSSMLPMVDAKVVKLEGSYHDKLSLNLFSMMIISNAVQSQRTDQDYFFHHRNRKSLLELVNNLRQASFYGGAFFSQEDILKAVQTADEFLDKGDVAISEPDRKLLSSATACGKLASKSKIKDLSKLFHEPPIYVKHFPYGVASAWSIDGNDDSELVCTNWKLMVAAQKALRPFLDSTEDLNTYLNSGSFRVMGGIERDNEIRQSQTQVQESKTKTTLAGNTRLGEDHVSPRKRHSAPIKAQAADDFIPTPPETPEDTLEIAAPIANTQLVSTTSAKLTYLIDEIIAHQKEEQIIVFYDNDNIAWYLAGALEMLSVHHLIYAKGISAERRAQYVSTFNNTTKFRVLLMDIAQAAFGLDMRAASRVYFISPVLNPQVEAQAVGRVRRISQKRRVTVETLVLKDSLEEVIMERKQSMTQAEHRNCKTILDDGPIYEWIRNAKIIPLPDIDVEDGPAQMVPLKVPQYIFGREFGRERSNPDEDILLEEPSRDAKGKAAVGSEHDGDLGSRAGPEGKLSKVHFGARGNATGSKRARFLGDEVGEASGRPGTPGPRASTSTGAKRARFATDLLDEEDHSLVG